MKRQRGEFPWDPHWQKKNDLNQVVESSGFSENKGLGWVLNLADS